MKLLTHYSQIPSDQWDALVGNSPVTSWFQTREAYNFFDSLSFTEPFVFGVSDNNQIVCLTVGYLQGDGGWLKQKLSRRAIIIGGPLLTCQTTEAHPSSMLSALRENLRKRCIYIETRNLNDYSSWKSVFEANGFSYQAHLNFHLDSTSLDVINSNLSRTRKRHIHVGLRDGATLETASSENDINEFYSILLDLYQTKVKKPLPPPEFFYKLHQLASATILVVKYNSQVIGGMAYVCLDKKVGYEWYVCGKDEAFKNLYPSELATYAGIKATADKGCPRFDFMGAGKPDVEYGVRNFKALFGGTLVEHGRFLFTCQPLVYSAGKLFMKIISNVK